MRIMFKHIGNQDKTIVFTPYFTPYSFPPYSFSPSLLPSLLLLI